MLRHATDAEVVHHDTVGRQTVVDYLLEWADGRVGALEVTLVTERAAIKAVELCDQWGVDAPSSLPDEVLEAGQEVAKFLANGVGSLRRTPFAPGIRLYQSTTAEFVEAAAADFSRVVESWHEHQHLAPHLEKVKRTPGSPRATSVRGCRE